jgi:proteic killer suppression protein
MNIPCWGLHPFKDKLKDHYSISVNGNWRMTVKFEGENVVLVAYQDYH